jgi:hypothetical protein
LFTSYLFVGTACQVQAGETGWIELAGDKGIAAWQTPIGAWFLAGGVGLDTKNPRRLAAQPGSGILVNGKAGRTDNLISKQKFGDLEAHIEFLIPKGSNSGVKFEGLYEIQIYDSFGVKKLTGSDCGGIYPRAEMEPRYHHINDGVAPRMNACLPAGQWQTLDVLFQAPRFDTHGKKIAYARFLRVVLNGQVIHENVEVITPTGHAWHEQEVPMGPLLLQADHGPVAFRSVRVRAYAAAAKSD